MADYGTGARRRPAPPARRARRLARRPDGATIEVLVEESADGSLDDLAAALPGVEVARRQSVRAVRLPVTALPALAGHDAVARIEAARPLFPELNWSRSSGMRRGADARGTAPITGAGVVVAVLDSGIDYTIRASGADGGTRIVSLWDQGADPGARRRRAVRPGVRAPTSTIARWPPPIR